MISWLTRRQMPLCSHKSARGILLRSLSQPFEFRAVGVEPSRGRFESTRDCRSAQSIASHGNQTSTQDCGIGDQDGNPSVAEVPAQPGTARAEVNPAGRTILSAQCGTRAATTKRSPPRSVSHILLEGNVIPFPISSVRSVPPVCDANSTLRRVGRQPTVSVPVPPNGTRSARCDHVVPTDGFAPETMRTEGLKQPRGRNEDGRRIGCDDICCSERGCRRDCAPGKTSNEIESTWAFTHWFVWCLRPDPDPDFHGFRPNIPGRAGSRSVPADPRTRRSTASEAL